MRQIGTLNNYNFAYKKKRIRFLLSRTIITKSGCMEWQGHADTGGYGFIGYKGDYKPIHRLIWELRKGEIPEGLCVLHKCDNKPCWNIQHLFLGTHQDNMKDRDQKGRLNHRFKLTPEKLMLLLEMAKEGILHKHIANQLGIHKVYVSHIARSNGIIRKIQKGDLIE